MPYRIEEKESMRIVGIRISLTEDMEENQKLVPPFSRERPEKGHSEVWIAIKKEKENVTMFGKDIYSEAPEIRTQISCVSQRISIDTHLSLTENMMFQSKLYKVPKVEARKRMEILISCFGLERYLKYPISSYSGGLVIAVKLNPFTHVINALRDLIM